LGFGFDDLGDKGAVLSSAEVLDAIVAVPKQFRDDARSLLLAPFVFGFGITTAMFSYYINGNVVTNSRNLGDVYIGMLEAFSYLVAAGSAYPYAYVSNHISGGQHWVFQFGSLAFLLSGLLVYIMADEELAFWQNILIIRALYGLGRGVFEGACRAVYAELFSGPDMSTAFSGQTLLAGLSGGICFFAYGALSRDAIAGAAVINGIVALLAYSLLLSMENILVPISWPELGRHILSMLGYRRAEYVQV
jgi:hypothetical protein